MRVAGVGGPRRVLETAFAALAREGLDVAATSPIIDSAPLGPSTRRYANAAAVVRTDLEPIGMLALLQAVEHAFGRRRRGRKWRARPLDLDIVLWSGGAWRSSALTIPHREFRQRAFVLGPAAAIACRWRDPVTGASLRHLDARLTQPRPLPRGAGSQTLSLGP